MARLMRPAELEEEYGISLRQQKQLIYRREIPVTKVGNLNFFDRREIDRWLAENTREVEAS